MFYFKMQELIGRNSVEAYNYYLCKVDWLEKNISPDKWELDRSSLICINGVNIPCGIKINDYKSAYGFIKDCI